MIIQLNDKDNDLHTFIFRHGRGWSVTEIDKNFDDALICVFKRAYPAEKTRIQKAKRKLIYSTLR